MISREQFLNKLREIGYSYKGETRKSSKWKKDGGTHRVFVPKTALLAKPGSS